MPAALVFSVTHFSDMKACGAATTVAAGFFSVHALGRPYSTG